jgi:hypothetical protein
MIIRVETNNERTAELVTNNVDIASQFAQQELDRAYYNAKPARVSLYDGPTGEEKEVGKEIVSASYQNREFSVTKGEITSFWPLYDTQCIFVNALDECLAEKDEIDR